MYSFGRKSKANLSTTHIDIQTILNELIKIYDVSILEGLRTTERQKKLFNDKKSTLDGVLRKSKHQGQVINGKLTSMAVDIMPYKAGTNAFSGKIDDKSRFYYMMGLVKAISAKLLEEGKISHRVRFGLDWDSDDIFSDQSFDDLPHMELV
jgi:peptidoglycan L-alanyl-D-glutamate endopeptidase CwlK